MSFREKSAWISFVSISVVVGYYYTTLFMFLAENLNANPFENPELVTHFFLSVAAITILEIVLHILIAIRSPQQLLAPKDERERLISLQAFRIAYYVMALLSILAAFVIVHHPGGRWGLGNIVLLIVVLGELTRSGGQIVYYRRGS